MDRRPTVSGQFYPGTEHEVENFLDNYLAQAGGKADRPTIAAMCPHAGWVFSGGVAGKTLGAANLTRRLLLLGPNHTGHGRSFSLWPDGTWLYPGGGLPVDQELAAQAVKADSRIVPDHSAHAREHSIEVIVPFLGKIDPGISIAPISISEPKLETLVEVGRNLGRMLAEQGDRVAMVVSSDMSHFLSQQDARLRDFKALDALKTLDPERLYSVVRENDISMCGVLPMTVALAAAQELGASSAEVVDYATSGDVTGDLANVVGYAGVLVS